MTLCDTLKSRFKEKQTTLALLADTFPQQVITPSGIKNV
jgi:hypothetical protein